MKLYLLSCQNIQAYTQRILPLLPEQRRLAYARSHNDLSLGAGLLLSSILDVYRDEDLVIGPHGKPSLTAGKPSFSLSHSGMHVLLGISDGLIGVDMERRSRPVSPAVIKRICVPVEMELDPLLVFTRKECAMKLTGLGFSLPPQEIDTTIAFRWQSRTYCYLSTEADGYLLSILSEEKALPTIQRLTPEALL